MTDDDRLEPGAYNLLKSDNDSRIKFIKSDKWIAYPRALEILKIVDDIFASPNQQRKRNVLIEGKSGNGKTTILKRIYKSHMPQIIDGKLFSPSIMIECPSGPDIDLLYAKLLFELQDIIPARKQEKYFQLKTLLSKAKTKVIIIDNLHDFRTGQINLVQKFMISLRKLEEFNVTIVASSTYVGRNIIRGEPQLASRFKFLPLSTWKKNDDFRDLLNAFERTLPLKKRSNLSEDRLLEPILQLSEGIFANFEEIIQEAAIMAITTGTEKINNEMIKNIPFNIKHQSQPLEKSEYIV